MAGDAKIVVDPHAPRTKRGVEPCHATHVRQKTGLPRTVARLALRSAAPGKPAPRLAVNAFDKRDIVRMPERRLPCEVRAAESSSAEAVFADEKPRAEFVAHLLRDRSAGKPPYDVLK